MQEHYTIFVSLSFELKLEQFGHTAFENRFVTVYENEIGGCVKVHVHYEPKEDAHILRDIAFEKALCGNVVEILPELLKHQHELRALIVPDAIGIKNPDLRINGELVEVKSTKSSKNRAIKDRLEVAAGQANKIIINIPEKYAVKFVEDTIEKKFIKHKNLKEIEIRYNGQYTSYFRELYIK